MAYNLHGIFSRSERHDRPIQNGSTPEPTISITDAIENNYVGKCPDCNNATTFCHQFCKNTADVLLVQLHRYYCDSSIRRTVKLDDPIEFGQFMQLPETMCDKNADSSTQEDENIESGTGPSRYELCAVTYHHGNGTEEGHYTVAAKGPDGIWRLVDDTKVEEKSFEEISQGEFSKSAYFFAYRKVGPQPENQGPCLQDQGELDWQEIQGPQPDERIAWLQDQVELDWQDIQRPQPETKETRLQDQDELNWQEIQGSQPEDRESQLQNQVGLDRQEIQNSQPEGQVAWFQGRGKLDGQELQDQFGSYIRIPRDFLVLDPNQNRFDLNLGLGSIILTARGVYGIKGKLVLQRLEFRKDGDGFVAKKGPKGRPKKGKGSKSTKKTSTSLNDADRPKGVRKTVAKSRAESVRRSPVQTRSRSRLQNLQSE